MEESNICFKKISRTLKITGECYIPDEFKREKRTDSIHKECVLPKGHSGKCSDKMNIFKKNETTKKLLESIRLSIYSTPGNDDYVFKNRASRLYPYCLTATQEKHIRDKKLKKKCAIPKKDSSTPHDMAEAYIDWMTFIVNVHDINDHIDNTLYEQSGIKDILYKNKQNLIQFYNNRKIFDNNGNSICVVTQEKINLVDIVDIERDNRFDIRETDIQLGHNVPRSDECITIKKCNLLPMSRIGNLIIREDIFTDDKWINTLKHIITAHESS